MMNYNEEDPADELRSTFTTYLAEGDKVSKINYQILWYVITEFIFTKFVSSCSQMANLKRQWKHTQRH